MARRWSSTPGTVLLSGATGTLGSLLAAGLVGTTAPQPAPGEPLGRSGAGGPDLRALPGGAGATVKIASCDVAERAELEELFASIDADHPLGAVIHAAGALGDATIEALSAAQVEHAFAPKADAARHLHG